MMRWTEHEDKILTSVVCYEMLNGKTLFDSIKEGKKVLTDRTHAACLSRWNKKLKKESAPIVANITGDNRTVVQMLLDLTEKNEIMAMRITKLEKKLESNEKPVGRIGFCEK